MSYFCAWHRTSVDGAMKFVGTHSVTESKRKRAEALQPKAKKLGLGPMVDRLVDCMTRSGLPPGLRR